MATLYELTKQQADIEALLMENGGELTPELELAWEETAESLPTKVDGYNAIMRNMQAQSDACAAEIKRLQELKKIADNGIKRIKNHLTFCMESFGKDKLEGQTSRFSLRKTTAIEVDEDEALSPYLDQIETFKRNLPPYITVKLSVSKTAVKEATKDVPDNMMPVGCSRITNTNLIVK